MSNTPVRPCWEVTGEEIEGMLFLYRGKVRLARIAASFRVSYATARKFVYPSADLLSVEVQRGICERYLSGDSLLVVANRFGVSTDVAYGVLRSNGFSRRPCAEANRIRDHSNDMPAKYIPTEEAIAQETARIRESWSEEEYKVRAGKGENPNPLPTYAPAKTHNGIPLVETH